MPNAHSGCIWRRALGKFTWASSEENNQDFADTLNLVKKIKFINSFSFIFSPRSGTVAADLELIDKKISMEAEIYKLQIIHG